MLRSKRKARLVAPRVLRGYKSSKLSLCHDGHGRNYPKQKSTTTQHTDKQREHRETQGRFLCGSFFFDSIWAFQPIVDVLPQQRHGVGRALLGMSHLLSERYPMQRSACPPAQFELLPTSQNLIYKIEVAPNTKIGLFSNKGQLQIILHRIMHSDPKLELRLWKSGLLSWIPLGDTSRRDYSVD